MSSKNKNKQILCCDFTGFEFRVQALDACIQNINQSEKHGDTYMSDQSTVSFNNIC